MEKTFTKFDIVSCSASTIKRIFYQFLFILHKAVSFSLINSNEMLTELLNHARNFNSRKTKKTFI